MMREHGGRIVRSASLAFSITAVFVAYQLLTDVQSPVTRNPALMLTFVVLCPPSLLSIPIDPEVGTNGFYFLWAVIGIANAALYATARAFIAARLKKAE